MNKTALRITKKIAETLSPVQKAAQTARWARTMTKWIITHSGRAAVKWRFVEFGGITGAESRGIIDILAVRKNHQEVEGLKRGDLLDVILIQTKGGSAKPPSVSDIERLRKVAKYHRAKAVVLAEWKIGEALNLYQLIGQKWVLATPGEIFG
jgi:hypothetical protein